MSAHIIDSMLYGDKYGTEEMRNVFSDKSQIGKWLKVEIALARAEGKLGLIPLESVKEIEKISIDDLDFMDIKKGIQETSQVVMPFLWAAEKHCKKGGGESLHWGVTSQDILDTAFILQIKEALNIIFRQIREVEEKLIKLAKRHQHTIMAGRTHGNQALPITFGFKIAIFMRELRRHIKRLQECGSRLFVGQLCGGVGNFASFEGKGPQIQHLVMEELGLGVAEISWQPARDRTGELACVLALIANSFGRIANEMFFLQRTEGYGGARAFYIWQDRKQYDAP